ncbi:MAG: beta-CASP ribonuclease aCPSF1 [Candidatus Bathyarchaeia archaeon]|nr:beta-CASP ribonuclease aCPSF1 [Candidatus Bathyarchaeota archaeon A05DMB-4]MDH7594630.1 beta-CASP ribonuclease aCPSF1 [Candidatus Bathyarchaeota archaeon]
MTAFEKTKVEISQTVLEHVPKEAEITRVEFEGPALAIYTKKPEMLIEQSQIIANIVNIIRKRIVVRSDPLVRVPEKEAERLVADIIPKEAETTNINFDPSLGEIIIEAKKPGLVIGKDGAVLQEIVRKTRWRPRILRTPPLNSKIVAHMRHYLHSESKERERILRTAGERIFRPQIHGVGDVRITALGGFQEVGRSSILLQTRESQVLLDCGINPGTNNSLEAFPRLDAPQFDLDQLDAVIISHAHLDHCGFLPFLFKYGYDGPVYCSAPTSNLMTLLQLDYLDVANKQGLMHPFDQKDVRECVLHTIPLRHGTVTDIAPDIRVTLHNAGHILGSSIVHLHVGEGLHNIVYTGDYKYAKTTLLEPAVTEFPRVETIITESTYGAMQDVMPSRVEAEEKLASIINNTLDRKGKVIIPVPAVGRAQEILLILDGYMRRGMIKEAPIFIEGMISEATAIHTTYPEYLAREVRNSILHEGVNPFQSDYFTNVEHPSARDEIIQGEPCIIMATSGMLEGGPVIEYFKQLASNENNTIIFVSYQIEGTLGRRIQKGLNEAPMMNSEGKIEVVKVALKVESIEGFSGHSDRRQIIAYIQRLTERPEKLIVCHGERAKSLSIANLFQRKFKVDSVVPKPLETIRLR